MGYWTGLFSRKPAPAPPTPAAATHRSFSLSVGNRQYPIGIVGESNYQSGIRRIAESVGRTCVVILQAEPENPHDANAIMVRSQAGDKIGYLSRGDAIDYKLAFDVMGTVNACGLCDALLVGGTAEKRSYGVLLDLRDPVDLLEHLATAITPLVAKPEETRPF